MDAAQLAVLGRAAMPDGPGRSALPGAPVVLERPPRAWRVHLAAVLRQLARLLDRQAPQPRPQPACPPACGRAGEGALA